MDTVFKLVLMCFVMGVAMFLLYRSGWMILSAKSAVTFVGSSRAKAASFSKCSGSIRRIVRFHQDRVYAFNLDSALTAGSMEVRLIGPDKREILCLNPENPSARAALEKQKRYTLILYFRSATGRYALQWKEQ